MPPTGAVDALCGLLGAGAGQGGLHRHLQEEDRRGGSEKDHSCTLSLRVCHLVFFTKTVWTAADEPHQWRRIAQHLSAERDIAHAFQMHCLVQVYTNNAYAIDGCATFFKRSRFSLVKKYEVRRPTACLQLAWSLLATAASSNVSPGTAKRGVLNPTSLTSAGGVQQGGVVAVGQHRGRPEEGRPQPPAEGAPLRAAPLTALSMGFAAKLFQAKLALSCMDLVNIRPQLWSELRNGWALLRNCIGVGGAKDLAAKG